jgi:pimeloyl-ACP methyl ester carboxylesterase
MDMAEDLESLRQYLDVPSFPVIMGHSNGGTIALAYAELYPTRGERLVLIGHQLLGTDAGPSGPTWDKYGGGEAGLTKNLFKNQPRLSNPLPHPI